MSEHEPDPRQTEAQEPREGDEDRSLFGVVAHWMRSLAGSGGRTLSLRESVEELLEEQRDSGVAVDEQERTMLLNLLEFGTLRVEDVMVPRADIVAVADDIALGELIRVLSEAGHSRLPVFHETLDNVTGLIHVRDLLPFWGDGHGFALADLVRDMPFVPPSMPVGNLLRQMRASKVHMALVVDEHGGTDGLVTIEDLVEEIVGEIEDEHDVAQAPDAVENPDGSLDIDARMEIEALEERLKVDLLPEDRDEDIDTAGGLVFDLAGRIPAQGEVIAHPAGLRFEVLEADPRRVRKLRVIRDDGGR